MFRLFWWVPAAVVTGIEIVAVSGGLSRDLLNSFVLDYVVVGLAVFAVAACIVAYRRKRA